MLSIATGHDVGYLTGAVASGREGYYTGAVDAGEPPGLWFGAGAEALGLACEVKADLMEALYSRLLDPRDPAAHNRETWVDASALAAGHRAYKSADTILAGLLEANPDAGPEQRAELRALAERSARQAVAFIDVTFSAPKSVTVLGVAFERAANDARAAGRPDEAAAWDAHAKAVEDAMLAGARAGLEFLQDEAGFSRVGHHGGGAGRWVDAHEFVVAQFLQHDSRDRDPQLHVHNAILNRVRCADGSWRTLDSRAIHGMRAGAGAVSERAMEAHLTQSLGVRFETRPDGRAREIVGVPAELTELFSSRRRALSARASELVGDFRSRYGREPSPAERFHLAQQATLSTRAAKRYAGETREQQLERWTAQCHDQITGGLGQVARDVLAAGQQAADAAEWSPRDVKARALAAVAETKQAWSRSALMRAISDALPGNLRAAPEEVRALIEQLTDEALAEAIVVVPAGDTTNLPASELLADGRSPYASPTGQLYTVEGTLSAEHALRAAAVERGAPALSVADAERVLAEFAAAGRTLGLDQAAAVRGVLTSGARVEVLSAAPGTGKSFVVGALAAAWTDTEGRRVFGLTPSQVAADVLAGEGVSAAANATAWLGAQRRLETAAPGAPDQFGDEAWRLRAGDLVVVDEANMATTGQLAEIQQRCHAADAKLLLTGDPAQLAAVGPGGALADVAGHGIRYELADVRRFTAEWERTASLRLRDADPDVLAEYDKHGRLISAGTAEQAEAAAARAWLGDTLEGRESLLLVRDNASAARISAALRAELVSVGRIEESGIPLGLDGWQGVTVGVGDLVQARRNGRELVGFEGNSTFPVNRAAYRVNAISDDGGLIVSPVRDLGGSRAPSLALSAEYVSNDLALGYASTVHAAEGRTVDTSHAVLGAGTDPAALLVAMTRGRDGNTAWTITQAVPADAATGETHSVEPRTARAVLADILETAQAERTATAQQEQAELDVRSTATHIDQLIDVIDRHITAGRTSAALDELSATGELSPRHRQAIAADDAFGSLERLLRTAELAGHDPRAVLDRAVGERSLDDARSPAQVLHSRITASLHGRLTPQLTEVADLIPRDVPAEWSRWLHDRADAVDTRRRELGAETAAQCPAWAERSLGPVPADAVERAEWEHRAGIAAAYRELVDHAGNDDGTDPLGAAPGAGLPEKQALFRAAHQALDLVDLGAEEADMTEGQLRARSHALTREENWAPQWVADQLAATRQQAEKARTDATVWAARAEAATNPDDAQRLHAASDTARREAEELGKRAQSLEMADDVRAEWFAHTAVTRDHALRARAQLQVRGIDPTDPDDRVTADEWRQAHLADQVEADLHREIRDEHDLHQPDLDRFAVHDGAETGLEDIREASRPNVTEHDDTAERRHVPTADATAEAVGRAQAALLEIAARTKTDAARAAEETERLTELGRWNHDEQVQEVTADRGVDIDDDYAMEL